MRPEPIWIALVVAGLAAGSAHGTCRPLEVGPCGIVLRGEGAPSASASCTSESWKPHLRFELRDRFADADDNGWQETVVELDLDPALGCGCAVFRVAFEGVPTGHSVHVGDSPTNDGHGGDAWSTLFDAELTLNGVDLAAFGSERQDSLSDLHLFGLRKLPLADRVLELEICDQSVRFAIQAGGEGTVLDGFFNTYTARDLIAIRKAPDDEASRATEPDSKVYASFNRVIHRRNGRPSKNRFGTGVRRVEISLTP